MRGWIYDHALTRLTAGWYREVLQRLPIGLRLLDVGVGTAGALAANAELIRERQLEITGIDIDRQYLDRSRRNLARAGLEAQVTIEQASILTFANGPFGAVYFSGSFMLIPEPEAACRQASSLLGGDHRRIYFTQTFQEKKSRAAERLKPLLRWLTTVDFGKVTYEAEFLEALAQGGLTVEQQLILGSRASQSYRLVIARQ